MIGPLGISQSLHVALNPAHSHASCHFGLKLETFLGVKALPASAEDSTRLLKSLHADTEQVQEGKPLVQYQPRARKVAPAPSEVPVVHSSSYLLKEKEDTFKTSRRPADTSQTEGDLDSTSNAVDWALRRADAYLDKVEADSSEHSAARILVQNPATRATMKTMQVQFSFRSGPHSECPDVVSLYQTRFVGIGGANFVCGWCQF